MKLSVLSREHDVRLKLIEGIDDIAKRVEAAAVGIHNPAVVAAFLRDYAELHATAKSLWSKSSALPHVQIGFDDIPFEARAKADKLRKFAVMSRLQQAKDVCLWRLEEQRRQLANEALESASYFHHLEMLLDRYAEEMSYVCYFCAERFTAGAANTRCLYNGHAPHMGSVALTPDPRVPGHVWGSGMHFWVPFSHGSAMRVGSELFVGAEPSMRTGIDDTMDVLSGPSGFPSRHSTPPRFHPWSEIAYSSSHLAPLERAVRDEDLRAQAAGQRPNAVLPQPSAFAPPYLSGTHPAPPWSAGFAPPGGHLSLPPLDGLLRKMAQACDRNGLDIRSAFRAFDANGDGFLSPLEFRHALSQLKVGVSDDEIAYLVSRLDTNSDGMVSYEEFLTNHFKAARDPRIAHVGEAVVDHFAAHDAAAHSLWQRVARAFRDRGVPLRQAFALFDVDNDGVISQYELQEAFKLMHLGLSDSDIERLMRDIDVNVDGKVSISEFVNRLQ
jgi:Ca2+-binding EF-hand superfamily protein